MIFVINVCFFFFLLSCIEEYVLEVNNMKLNKIYFFFNVCLLVFVK